MLDLRMLREETDRVRQGLAARHAAFDLDRVLALDAERRDLIFHTEAMKKRRNEASRDIGRLKQAGQETETLQTEIRGIGDQIKANDERLRAIEDGIQRLLLLIPNIPHSSAPVGRDERDNVLVRTWGEPPQLDFPPKPHWELGEALGLLDLPRAAKLAGSGFVVFRGAGARLERALIAFMLDLHVREHGFTEIHPPFLASRQTMTGTGQLPKMEEDMYRIDAEDLFLIPTAEVQLVNLFRDEMLVGLDLPLRVAGHTACFRREAGSYGKDVRGLIRVHQFDKVEMVSLTTPETSYDELERLLGFAETVLRRLGFHYRVIELCTGDFAFQAAKCYDIEVWAPGVGRYLEVSSVSNCEDFQARRANIRFKRDERAKPEFVHTLNGSGVALPRCLIALLESCQEADGSIVVPEALRPYMGAERIAQPDAQVKA